MKITTVTRIREHDLVTQHAPPHIFLNHDDGASVNFSNLHFPTYYQQRTVTQLARENGRYSNSDQGWTFSDRVQAQIVVDRILQYVPETRIIINEHVDPTLVGAEVSRIALPGSKAGCLIPHPLPYFTNVFAGVGSECFALAANGATQATVALVIGALDQIDGLIADLTKYWGATLCDAPARRWGIFEASTENVDVSVCGWTIRIKCDLTDPRHYKLMPEHGRGQWDGIIKATRKTWPRWRDKILAAGLHLTGDDPEADVVSAVAFDTTTVAGWNSPAPNGHTLHAYQRDGAEFCARRGMRAMIGDEMGIGKTAQAIAATEATVAPRVLVICPANARYVWDRELRGWGAAGRIQHIKSQLDNFDMDARWHIVTYDQLAPRQETWRVADNEEEQALLAVAPSITLESPKTPAGAKRKSQYPKKASLQQAIAVTPAFADPKRIVAWGKIMRRLRAELRAQIIGLDPLLVIVDEAHRVKNREAKRTQVIQQITTRKNVQLLLLTGTPLRNNEGEAATLLGLLDPEALNALSGTRGYTIRDVKDYLSYFMIRRTKAEVLPELPTKTRQRIDIGGLSAVELDTYRELIFAAADQFRAATIRGDSEGEARNAARGTIEKSRVSLGLAKVRGGEVAELVVEIVENKGCCVVFSAHHNVSDTLRDQLLHAGIKVVILDGRTPQVERARIVQSFQDGDIQALIGGIQAAGEAITLTRADTAIFVELDWVPAALQQAEDRIHRIGQSSNCQIIHLIAHMDDSTPNLDHEMVEVIGSKLERIGQVLDEDTSNIVVDSADRNKVMDRIFGAISAQKAITAREGEGAALVDVGAKRLTPS